MNKFGIVLGVAAVATLAGCKDPDYNRGGTPSSRNEIKNADTTVTTIEPVAAKCTCPPGTKHATPCVCGAPDCRCVVESKPIITADLSSKSSTSAATGPAAGAAAAAETTVYVVQSGDYLSKISKRYNVTIASIKRLNPSIKEDNKIRVGQKLKLPGKIDVGEQKTSATAHCTVRPAKNVHAPYTGATKDYVVKSGDTIGALAYGNGLTIRQFKELNGLSSDSLRVGQKLKIPAQKVVKTAKSTKKAATTSPTVATAKTEAKAAAASSAEAASTAAPAEPAAATAPVAESTPAVAEPAAPAVAEAKPAQSATTTYVVQEGDDMTGVSIRWGVSAAEIRELNNLSDTDQLVPGQIIKLPAEAQQ